MRKIVLISLLTALKPLLAAAQAGADGKSASLIHGNYRYMSADKLSGITLDLNPDHTFHYEIGGCIQTYHADGIWDLKQDTLTLSCSLTKDNIPVQIEEEVVDSIKGDMVFDPVLNLDHEEMGAALYFNGDTTTVCDPLLMWGCTKKIGSVDSILVEVGGARSRWYKLRNKSCNRLRTTVMVHDRLVYYLFLSDEKYLFKNESLFLLPVVQQTELDEHGNEVKRTLILEKEH